MAVFVLQLLALSVSYVSIELQFKCIMFSMSMSGMPNKACPFLGATKNLHIFCLLLHYVFTLHMPNWVIIVLLYVFNWMFLFSAAANCSFVSLGNILLYKCKGTMFPSLPVFTLYGTIIETCFDDTFRFGVINNLLLLKIIEFKLTMLI